MQNDDGSPLPRLQTGVPRLDFILEGGLVRGATYSLVGAPGTGKTVLANQIAFNHVKSGGRGLYVTLLSENHTRLLGNLRTLTFFDATAVPEKLFYVSGYRLLEREGLAGLLNLVQSAVRKQKATYLVIDGIDAAGDFAESELSFKKFVHELQAFANLLNCTTVLVGTRGPEADHPENTSVDGILELSLRLVGARAVRELTVLKLRGSGYLLGRHEAEIRDDGMVIHPRTEVQFGEPSGRAREDRVRMRFGVESLDQALHGGILSGSATTLLGGPGTGKTLLGLQFLAQGAEEEQPGVYFGFMETPPRLIEKAGALNIPLERHVKSGLIEIQWQPPLESNLDGLAERLLERIRERDVGRKRLRVFIDGVSGFRAASVYPERMGRFLNALTHQLRLLDVTTLFAEELALFSTDIAMPNAELGGAVENVILLRNVELRSQLYRLISIMKMRESDYDRAIREFSISSEGLSVARSFESAEAILTGQARTVGGGAEVGGGERGRRAPRQKGAAKMSKTKGEGKKSSRGASSSPRGRS